MAINSAHVPAAISAVSGLTAHILVQRFPPTTIKGMATLIFGAPIALGWFFVRQGLYHNLAWSLLVSHVVYWATLSTSVVAYRLSPFHPLAKYPGPLMSRITRLWATHKVLQGKQHIYYHELHEKYGDVVRTGPDHLHIRDVKAITTVLGPGSDGRRWYRGIRYTLGQSEDEHGGSLVRLQSNVEHSQRRRIWEKAFTPTALKDYEPMIHKRASKLLAALQARQGQEVDIGSWFGFFSIDFMSDLAFDGALNYLDKGVDDENFQRNLEAGVRNQEALGTITWTSPFLQFVLPPALKKMYEISSRQILQRKGKSALRKDLFFYLLDEDGSSGHEPLDLRTLSLESALAIIAGSDTTSVSLSNTFYYLMKHPEVFECLRRELDEGLSRDDEYLEADVLAKFPLLQAVINEVLRLQPGVPNGVQRLPPVGDEPAMIGNIVVPQGTTVQVPTYSIHRDPRYFYPRPNDFWPERWLVDAKKANPNEFRLNTTAWMPFSYGPTNCVGRRLAINEMRIIIAMMVRTFDFKFAPGWNTDEWEQNLHDGFVLSKGKLPVIVTPRAA